jgi:hypothetical protein
MKIILIILSLMCITLNSAEYRISINSYNSAITVSSIFNESGFNRAGLHQDTGTQYDSNGLNSLGYDENGFNVSGIHKDTGNEYNLSGFDINGFDQQEFNASNNGQEICILNGDNGSQYRLSSYQNSPTQYWGEAYVRFNYEGNNVSGAAITYSVGINGTNTMSTQTVNGKTGYVLFSDSKYMYTNSTAYNSVPFSGSAGHTYYGVCRTRIQR